MSDLKIADLKIAFCQWTFKRDFEETKLCIERTSPHVDSTIVVYNPVEIPYVDENDIKNIKWLNNNKEKYNIYTIISVFNDNFPEQRNMYIEKAKELGVDWCCTGDPDEIYSKELASNIRQLIKEYNGMNYHILNIPCRDQFDCYEWLDDLDKLKECPGGYKVSDFWKPLVFKIFDDLRYEGVGIEKNVHETMTTRFKRRAVNIPKDYFYIHKKSALDIWRNASRNFFIGGGGDNVGNKNRLWNELRQLSSSFGINTWSDFESFIETGVNLNKELTDKQKDSFRKWLKSALQSPPTNYGTETRECAKWYFALHRDEIDEEIRELIDKKPTIDEETELENYVSNMYFRILGRHPDQPGLQHYIESIKTGAVKRVNLIDIFRNSDEYKEKFGTLHLSDANTKLSKLQNQSTFNIENYTDVDSKYDKEKWKKIERFVSRTYMNVLGREPDKPGKIYYTKSIMDKIIKPSELAEIFVYSDEYVDKYATPFMMNIINKEKSMSFLKKKTLPEPEIRHESSSKHNTISLCIMGLKAGIPLIKQSIKVIGDKMDEIHIQADDFTEDDIKDLKTFSDKVQVHIEPWVENFSDYKNKSISYAKTEWIISLDHDEIPSDEFSREIRKIIKSSDRGNNYDMVSFDTIEVRTIDGKEVSEVRSKGGKALLHWNIPNPYEGNPHIWLRHNYYPWKEIHSDIAYKHIKEQDNEIKKSAMRVFLSGGGDNVKERNPHWLKLRKVCDELKIDTYKKFDEYLKKGNIDNKLLDILKNLYEQKWKDDELKDVLRYYYMLHPEEQKD